MRALRFEDDRLQLTDVPSPSRVGEALVRVTLAGVCNTDLEIARGYAGFRGTLGHEFVGVAVSAPGAPEWEGRGVVGEISAGCGVCELCRAGAPRHCAARTVLGIVGRDGAFAEFLQLPVVNLLPVPDSVPDERAVFTEPLAAACGILERTEIEQGTRVAVIGEGKLGLLCAQAIKALTNADVTLIGKHPNKLEVARRRDIETVRLEQIAEARTFDTVVEASGAAGGFDPALQPFRPRGLVPPK